VRDQERAGDSDHDRPVTSRGVSKGRRQTQSSMTWLWVLVGLIVVGVIVWFLFFRDSSSAAVAGTWFGVLPPFSSRLNRSDSVRAEHLGR
jgi:hypothetical protein